MCEEYSSCQTRTVRPELAGQSDPLFAPASLLMKTPTPSTDDPVQEDPLQKYQERVERLSQQNRVIKICTDAGFLTTVEVGQFFMTKDTDEFSQFTEPVTCRENTLPRDETSTDLKGWIRGNTKIGPVLEVTHGVEITIESVNNFHSWVKNFSWPEQIAHRLGSTRNTMTTSRRPLQRRRKYLRLQADPRLKQNQEDLQLLAHLQQMFLSMKELGLILSQQIIRLSLTQCQNN